jgi:hypothetical protein
MEPSTEKTSQASMRRKPHTKSRRGCHQCKQRHRKASKSLESFYCFCDLCRHLNPFIPTCVIRCPFHRRSLPIGISVKLLLFSEFMPESETLPCFNVLFDAFFTAILCIFGSLKYRIGRTLLRARGVERMAVDQLLHITNPRIAARCR